MWYRKQQKGAGYDQKRLENSYIISRIIFYQCTNP